MSPVVYAFEDVDNLCRGAEGAYQRCRSQVGQSRLYRFRGEYRLVLYPLNHGDCLSACSLLEYASGVHRDPVAAAFVQEHGCLVLADDAIGVLFKMFGEPGARPQ
jgi:Negative regulator of genetic competence (MecA).